MLKKFGLLLLFFAVPMSMQAEEEVKEEVKEEVVIEIDKVSETLGHLIIKQLNNPLYSFNIEKIVVGMKDGMEGKSAPLSEEEYEEQVMAIQEKIFQKTSENNLAEAEKFLEKNQKEEGVIAVTPQLQYKIVAQGEEGAIVDAESTPLIHYTGKTLDGNVFASSQDSNSPMTLPLKSTIPGFSKGLVGMKKGEKRTLYIHPELAFGLASHLPPNSLLVFEVEVLETHKAETAAQEEPVDLLEGGNG